MDLIQALIMLGGIAVIAIGWYIYITRSSKSDGTDKPGKGKDRE